MLKWFCTMILFFIIKILIQNNYNYYSDYLYGTNTVWKWTKRKLCPRHNLERENLTDFIQTGGEIYLQKLKIETHLGAGPTNLEAGPTHLGAGSTYSKRQGKMEKTCKFYLCHLCQYK